MTDQELTERLRAACIASGIPELENLRYEFSRCKECCDLDITGPLLEWLTTIGIVSFANGKGRVTLFFNDARVRRNNSSWYHAVSLPRAVAECALAVLEDHITDASKNVSGCDGGVG